MFSIRRLTIAPLLVITLLLLSCNTAESQTGFDIEVAFPKLAFVRPVDLQSPGDGSNRLFVVEQPGNIRWFDNDTNADVAQVFLAIRDRVDDGGEKGLLGLAFHPDYPTNGYFFVNYVAAEPLRTVVSRFSVDPADPNRADPNSENIIMTVPQPYSNHNGGQIQFGPDGMLYIALGDGGSGGDPQGHGQNRSTLLGSILRIDVDNPQGELKYGIPVDNPFVGNTEGYREEIFAYGLRNPWRFSFDVAGRLWTGDVGQNRFEEIDIVESGKNYGWNVMEAFGCYNANTCSTAGLELPVHAYPHEDRNNSVTGGHVYRGSRTPALTGKYVYADFISGRVWSLTASGSGYENELLVDSPTSISSFGVDASNELYLCGFDGRIHRLVETVETSADSPTGMVQDGPSSIYPNPFSTAVSIPFVTNGLRRAKLTVHDALGRLVASLVDEVLPAGSHSAQWNGLSDAGQPVAAGVYYLRYHLNGAVFTRPVVYQPE